MTQDHEHDDEDDEPSNGVAGLARLFDEFPDLTSERLRTAVETVLAQWPLAWRPGTQGGAIPVNRAFVDAVRRALRVQ